MHRVVAFAAICAIGSLAASAAEVCLTCEGPAASYRCVVEQPSEKYKIGGDAQQEMCAKVLAKQGQHQKCQLAAVPEGGQCAGGMRTVTVADYQRAVGNADASTYEEGAFEIARRSVHDTWLCVSSMFKDC